MFLFVCFLLWETKRRDKNAMASSVFTDNVYICSRKIRKSFPCLSNGMSPSEKLCSNKGRSPPLTLRKKNQWKELRQLVECEKTNRKNQICVLEIENIPFFLAKSMCLVQLNTTISICLLDCSLIFCLRIFGVRFCITNATLVSLLWMKKPKPKYGYLTLYKADVKRSRDGVLINALLITEERNNKNFWGKGATIVKR